MSQHQDEVEVFLPMKSFPNYYISNHGNIVNNKLGYDIHVPLRLNKYGCPIVELINKKNNKKIVLVHRLVAMHFVPKNANNIDSQEVDFIDKNKLNHRATNLKWV